MISRRSIRIKVLQALYSQVLSGDKDAKDAIEIYRKSILDVLDVNLIYLLYIVEVIGYVQEYAKQQGGKYLINEEEKYVNTNILKGSFYRYFSENQEYQKQIKKQKTANYIQSEFVRAMFFEFIKLKEYKDYIADSSIANESILIQAFCKRILFRNEDLKNYLESYYANVEEDSDLVHFTLRRSLRDMVEQPSLTISLGHSEMKALESFAIELIRKTIEHRSEYIAIIEPKLVGWELDRIPVLDMLIIQMAMTEMLYFETIPLKVTVNEYIDLSKMFCSLKSKDFINGIVDRIMKELLAQGRIVKKGRGLN